MWAAGARSNQSGTWSKHDSPGLLMASCQLTGCCTAAASCEHAILTAGAHACAAASVERPPKPAAAAARCSDRSSSCEALGAPQPAALAGAPRDVARDEAPVLGAVLRDAAQQLRVLWASAAAGGVRAAAAEFVSGASCGGVPRRPRLSPGTRTPIYASLSASGGRCRPRNRFNRALVRRALPRLPLPA